MAIVVVDAFEEVDVQYGHQQLTAITLPACHLQLLTLVPGGPIGQTGEGIGKGLLPLFFDMVAKALGFLLHARHPLDQGLQAPAQGMFQFAALALVLIHGAEQAVQTGAHHFFQAIQVGRFLHAAVQAADLLTQLTVQLLGRTHGVGVAFVGILQVVLESRQAFVELFEIALKLTLAEVGYRQHEHGEIIQHRYQLIQVEAGDNPLTQAVGLRTMALRHRQFVNQSHQRFFHMLGDGAVTRLW